jgi:hypothetical protein
MLLLYLPAATLVGAAARFVQNQQAALTPRARGFISKQLRFAFFWRGLGIVSNKAEVGKKVPV